MYLYLILCFCSVASAMWPAFPFQSIPNAPRNTGLSPSVYQPREPLQVQSEDTSESTKTCLCRNEMRIWETRLRSEHQLLENFQSRLDDLSNVIYDLRAKVRKYDQQRQNAEQTFGPRFGERRHVAFSVRTKRNKSFLGPTETIVFDDIVVNNGDAYDPLTGIFTAPVEGVYHFSSTILSDFNSTIETMFVLNGEDVGRMFSGAFLSRGSGSNNILLNLKGSDQVSINVFYGNGDYVHGIWSTFMGYLINSSFY